MIMSALTNISSLTAQNNLSKSQSKLSTAIERLSSGMRINSAKDDAAGLAIATRFTTQINGLNQAVRNSQDGISLAQTTESALQQVTSNMQRIRELAVQSANASNSASDRAALNQEVQQRLSEITRIAQQTSFNGLKVLDGSQTNLSFQVGANAGEVINVNLSQGVQASQVGQLATDSVDVSSAVGAPAGLTLAAGDLTVNVNSGGAVNVAAGTYTDVASLASAINTAAGSSIAAVNGTTGELTITGPTGGVAFGGTAATTLGLGTVAAAATADSTGAVAATSQAAGLSLASGDLTFQVGSGTPFDITGNFTTTQGLADAINAHSDAGINAYVGTNGKLNISSAQAITVSGAQASTLGFQASDAVGTATLASADVSTVDGANATINRIDASLQTVSDLRSQLGAVQNRFDSTISNLQTIAQNLDSSRSQIQDANFASETANMSSAQILQQAGVSVLSQANSSQQIVLKLLQ